MFLFKIQTWSRVASLSYIPCFFSALQSVLWILRAFTRKGIAYGWTLICHIKDEGVCVLSCFSLVQLCNPLDRSPPETPLHGILQTRILEWVAKLFSRGSSQPQLNCCLLHWQTRSLPLVPPGKPRDEGTWYFSCMFLSQTCILFLWLFHRNCFLLFLGEQDVEVGRNMPPFSST